MIIDLGFMKLPFEGDLSLSKLITGIFCGVVATVFVFNQSELKGPALLLTDRQEFMNAISNSVIVSVCWMIIYYNYVGCSILATFCGPAVFGMYSNEDVTDKYGPNASRFAGNMFEHAPMFFVGLWMYTLFADYESGAMLGFLYIARLVLYPLYYMLNHKFTFWFETNTQIGYGVIGCYMLGCLYQAFYQASGSSWVDYAGSQKMMAPLYGFLVGSWSFVPGIPLTPIYMFLHYKFDRMFKLQEEEARKPLIEEDRMV